ncbi:MAG: tol-pal system YbgF family protein [Vicinamibacterales bacterium]
MPRHLLRYSLVAFLVGAAVSTPAGAANREHQQMMADIRMLQEQVQQLQIANSTLLDALKAVTAKIEEQNGVTLKAFADQKLIATSLASDLRVVREKVDDNNVRISSVGQEVEALRMALPSLVPPAPALPGDPLAETPPGQQPTAPAAAGAALAMSPDQMFRAAWSDYTAGSWSLAIQGFESYIRTYPNSERVGEAQYYIGKTYFNDGKFEEAVSAFNKVITDHPGDPITLASAYYNRGLAQERLGQVAAARESYEHVVKNFPPENPSTGLARQGLDRLNRK